MKTSRNDAGQERELVLCDHNDCPSPAILTIERGVKLVSVCREHYDEHHTIQALKWNLYAGLDTVEKRRDFIKNRIRQVISGMVQHD